MFSPTGNANDVPQSATGRTSTEFASNGPGFVNHAARVITIPYVDPNRSRPSNSSVAAFRGNVTLFRISTSAPAENDAGSFTNPGGFPFTLFPSPQICVVVCVGFARSVSYPSSH